jgi:D-alanyl-D-alanine carboxypeptidase
VTTGDLLHLVLIASDNAAGTRARARVAAGLAKGFIVRMNEKAAELGLESTHYADPSGLLSRNVSVGARHGALITHASQDERIASIMRLNDYTVLPSAASGLDRSQHEPPAAAATSTCEPGRRVHLQGRLLPGDGAPPAAEHANVAVVVFGARSNAGRFMESRNLFTWATAKASTLSPPSGRRAAPA